MSKNIEITFIKRTKLNSQTLLPGHIIKLPEELAVIYVRQLKAIKGAKDSIEIIRNGKRIKIDTELVEGRDKMLADKAKAKKEGESASFLSKINKALSGEDKIEDPKDINLALLNVGELKAIAIKEGAIVNSQAKEKGCIKAILAKNPNYKNEALQGE